MSCRNYIKSEAGKHSCLQPHGNLMNGVVKTLLLYWHTSQNREWWVWGQWGRRRGAWWWVRCVRDGGRGGIVTPEESPLTATAHTAPKQTSIVKLAMGSSYKLYECTCNSMGIEPGHQGGRTQQQCAGQLLPPPSLKLLSPRAIYRRKWNDIVYIRVRVYNLRSRDRAQADLTRYCMRAVLFCACAAAVDPFDFV